MLKKLEVDMNGRSFLKNNPCLQSPTKEGLVHVLGQYIFFPQAITRMLGAAAKHFAPESGVRHELIRNIQEERGSKTGGIPHVELLVIQLERELGFVTDGVQQTASTTSFLREVQEGMSRDRWFALGQAFALEASAVPELSLVIGPMINTYAHLKGLSEPIPEMSLREDGASCLSCETRDDALRLTLADWIGMHVQTFEVGHRDRLREEAEAVLGEGDTERFRFGFIHVLDRMDEWWSALALLS